MKRLITLSIALLSLSVNATTVLNGDHEIAKEALNNFEYVSDVEDNWIRHDNITKEFRGDCEDFAFSLQGWIGGTVEYVILKTGEAHAVLVKDGVVYDNYYGITPKAEYKATFFNLAMDYETHKLVRMSEI